MAKEAENEKKRRYPDGQTPRRAVPLATETCGRHSREVLTHLKKLARKQADKLEEGGAEAASSLVQRWGAWLSVALHRANARVVGAALGVDDGQARSRELASEAAR